MLSSVCLVSHAYSDVTYTFQITDRFDNETAGQRIEKIYVKEGKIKIAVEGESAQIIDLDRQSVLFINYPKQTYSLATSQELREQLLQKKETVRAAFAALFQEQANSEDNSIPADPTSESFYQVKELGQERNHQDWKCRTMTLESNQRKMEICAASDITGLAEFKRALELLQMHFEDTPFLTDALRAETLLLSQDLFPIQTTTHFGESGANSFTEEKFLSKIETSRLDENLFNPPKDFVQNNEAPSI